MRNHTLTDTAALLVEDHHLVVLVAPINSHKPLVRDARLLRQTGMLGGLDGFDHPTLLLSLGGSHGLCSALYGRSWRNFLQEVNHGVPAGVQVQLRRSKRRARRARPAGDLHAQVVRIAVQGATSMTPAFPISNGTGRCLVHSMGIVARLKLAYSDYQKT